MQLPEDIRDLWLVIEQHREQQTAAVAAKLGINGHHVQNLHEALDRTKRSLLRTLRAQFGTLLVERMDTGEIDELLVAFLHSVGTTINDVRSHEALTTSRRHLAEVLAGVGAGATAALRDPEEGSSLAATFGPLTRPAERNTSP